jgi:putative lipoprotein
MMGTVVLSLFAVLPGTGGEALAAGSTQATTRPAGLHDSYQMQLSPGNGGLTYAQTGGTAMVTGTVGYRQRIALTPEAVITVTLVDQSRADAPAEVIGQQVITNPGQVPVPFSVSYDPSTIVPSHTYAVQAVISDQGRVMFRTTSANLVITQGHPTQVDLVLEMVSAPALPTAGTGASLAGTSWVLTEYAVQREAPLPAVSTAQATLTFGNNGNVSGNTGCNSFGGPYTQNGDQLTFGPLATTLQACLDPDVTRQEQTIFSVLNGNPISTVNGDQLTISAPGGMLAYVAANAQNTQPGMPTTGGGGPAPSLLLLLQVLASLGVGLGAGLRLAARRLK